LNKIKNIAIIPARGGSKRLPKKNIIPLNGKPLIQYSIEFALNNKDILDTIIVSTDSREIKSIASQSGIEIIDRPEHFSTDTTPTVAVLKHALNYLPETYNNVFLLQPTNPLRPQNLLIDAYNTFLKTDVDSLMTVTRNHQKFGKIINDRFNPFNYKMGQRSQDLEPLYVENGLLYITTADLILKGEILGERNYPFIVNHSYASVDIDSQLDLDWASFLMNKNETNEY